MNGKIQAVGSLGHYKNDQMNRVYSPEGIAPTIETISGGGREPKILIGGAAWIKI